jgi:hypothetical protein
MPHATDQPSHKATAWQAPSPQRSGGIDFQSCRGVLGGLCVREFISGFGCGSAALGSIVFFWVTWARPAAHDRSTFKVGDVRRRCNARCGQDKAGLRPCGKTTETRRHKEDPAQLNSARCLGGFVVQTRCSRTSNASRCPTETRPGIAVPTVSLEPRPPDRARRRGRRRPKKCRRGVGLVRPPSPKRNCGGRGAIGPAR